MKHNELLSVAHNIADSLASGSGFVVGYWPTDVYGEAARCPEGNLTIDFLTGEIAGGHPSKTLSAAVIAYRDVLPSFCEKHGISIVEFNQFTVQYSGISSFNGSAVITITDSNGRQSIAEYSGNPLKRALILDDRGRPRRAKHRH